MDNVYFAYFMEEYLSEIRGELVNDGPIDPKSSYTKKMKKQGNVSASNTLTPKGKYKVDQSDSRNYARQKRNAEWTP